MNTETLLKILAIVIVASWAFAGLIRLLYPGVWKWIVDKISEIILILFSPCIGLFSYFWPRLSFENSSGLKQHYILPIKTFDGDRESFSPKSFTENDKRRKSEGSLKFERRKTQHNISLEPINTSDININTNNIAPPTPSTLSNSEGRNRSQSKTKKEGRRRGPAWMANHVNGRNPLAGRGTSAGAGGGGGNKPRGRLQQSINGFDYEFEQPNYDFPQDSNIPPRTRGPSEFDILNPLQPLGTGESSDLLDIEALDKNSGNLRYTRSMSANIITNSNNTINTDNSRGIIQRTASYSNGTHPNERTLLDF